MIIPVSKARRLARTYLAERGDFDMSITHLHLRRFLKEGLV